MRISKAIRNLEDVENLLIANLKVQQHREKNAELMLEQAYENAAVPKRMRAASSLPAGMFAKVMRSGESPNSEAFDLERDEQQ